MVFAKQARNGVVKVVEAFFNAQIQHLLVASFHGGALAGGGQDPLGVGAGQVRGGVYHFGFEPQAKLHAFAGDGIDDGGKPLRPGFVADVPIAQAFSVVAPGAEPSVVQDKSLHADGCRFVYQV